MATVQTSAGQTALCNELCACKKKKALQADFQGCVLAGVPLLAHTLLTLLQSSPTDHLVSGRSQAAALFLVEATVLFLLSSLYWRKLASTDSAQLMPRYEPAVCRTRALRVGPPWHQLPSLAGLTASDIT